VGPPPALPLPADRRSDPSPDSEVAAEPFEDAAPGLETDFSAVMSEEPDDTQPDPPDIERAAAELGSFAEPESLPAPSAARVHPPAPASPPTCASSGAMSPDVILRALSQLLVEKGVLTRDELVERLRTLAANEAGERPQS